MGVLDYLSARIVFPCFFNRPVTLPRRPSSPSRCAMRSKFVGVLNYSLPEFSRNLCVLSQISADSPLGLHISP